MSRILIFALAAILSATGPMEFLNASATTTNTMAVEGEAFDRAFVAQLVKDEQEAVDQLKLAADLQHTVSLATAR